MVLSVVVRTMIDLDKLITDAVERAKQDISREYMLKCVRESIRRINENDISWMGIPVYFLGEPVEYG